MNDLLQFAVNAHGGLKRWNEISTITVAASLTGAIWFVKSQGDYLKDVVMTVDTTKERLVTDFPGQDKRFIFEPQQSGHGTPRWHAHPGSARIQRKSSSASYARRLGTISRSRTSKARLCGRI